jgi:hypothetical protein
MAGMNPIDLIVTVCAVLSPATCEETHLVFNWSGSHPKWNAVRWRCEYPHANDKADAGQATSAG